MAKRKTKSTFIGIKATSDQAALLAKLQKELDSTSKTDVLLKGLELLAQLSASGTTPTLKALSEGQEITEPATSLELAKLEVEARKYSSILQQTKNKTEGVIKQVIKEITQTDKILSKHSEDITHLIQILLDIQHENNWLPKEALIWVSQKLGAPLNQIYHIATFYKAFSLVPKGRHCSSVCMGTACQVRNSTRLLDRVTEILKIAPGETSGDMRFSLDTVNCLGCCAIAPVMVIDDKYYSNPSTEELKRIFAACK